MDGQTEEQHLIRGKNTILPTVGMEEQEEVVEARFGDTMQEVLKRTRKASLTALLLLEVVVEEALITARVYSQTTTAAEEGGRVALLDTRMVQFTMAQGAPR